MSKKYKTYKKYKDSSLDWAPRIPEHWDLKKAKNIFDRLQRPTRENDGIVTAFRDGEVTLRSNRRSDGFTNSVKEIGYQGVRKGDLLIHAMDGFAGAIGISDSDGKCSPVCSVCVPKNSMDVNILYYGYLTRQLAVTNFISSLAKGIRERSTEFRYNEFSNLELPIPDKNEQSQIANFLQFETAKIDKLITKQEKLIELLKEKRQAIISQAVTKGINPDVRMKNSDIDWFEEIPEHWEKSYLGFECSINGRVGWKGLKAEEYVDHGYIFLATPNIKNNEIDFQNVNYITKERYDESPEIQLKIGDILVTKDGSTTGTTNIVRELPAPSTVNSSIAVIRSFGSLYPDYIFYYFKSHYIQNVIELKREGMGVPHLFQADLRKFKILIPPINEQKLIADFISSRLAKIDEILKSSSAAIHLLHERKKAMISAAVTGKIDVRDWQPPKKLQKESDVKMKSETLIENTLQ